MRLAAQRRGGFYPAPPETIAYVLTFLVPPTERPFTILDPCAGKGAALAQLAAGLHCPAQDVYAIELEEQRALATAAALPGAHVLAPCDFEGTAITVGSLSLIWCNPPFDDELGGGGRVEFHFLERATSLLAFDGVMALACPERVSQARDLRRYLLGHYHNLAIVPYPEPRRFGEVIIFGQRRKEVIEASGWDWRLTLGEAPQQAYRLPPALGPKRFVKADYTPAERARALASSPLARLLEPPVELPLRAPGLPPAKGQLTLLMASGRINGVVTPPGEDSVVIRGGAHKHTYTKSTKVTEDAEGKETTTIIYGEKIVPYLRVLGRSGHIKTFSFE